MKYLEVVQDISASYKYMGVNIWEIFKIFTNNCDIGGKKSKHTCQNQKDLPVTCSVL